MLSVDSFLAGLMQYLAKNMVLLVQILGGKNCQHLFSAILRLKTTKFEGGGGMGGGAWA